MRFSATGYSLDLENPEVMFTALANAGFKGIETYDYIIPPDGLAAAEAFGAAAAANGVPVVTHHLPFSEDRDIASFYESLRRNAVEAQLESLELAAAFGAKIVIQHPSARFLDIDIESADRYLEQLVKSLDALAPRAADLGIRIAVENMMDHRYQCYFGTPEHIRAFSAAATHSAVGFCLDTGHALISMGIERQLEIMEAMGARIIAYHIQDNPGDRDVHIAPGRGLVDFVGTFARAKSFTGVMCIETSPFGPQPGPTLDEKTAAWSALLQETEALVE